MELRKIRCEDLPSRNDIREFMLLVIDYLFPNYFREVEKLITLEAKIHRYFKDYISKDDTKEKIFFSSLEEVYQTLLTDLEMAYQSDPACSSKEEALISYPGVYAIIIYRIAHILYQLDLKLIARIISEMAHSKTGIDIHPGAQIGAYFFIDHGTGVVIGETTIIGHHVKIYQGVTLGAISLDNARSLNGVKRHPTIGNYVTLYSNASILGGETKIGDHTVIGSNVFLFKSIEANKKVYNKALEIIMKETGDK